MPFKIEIICHDDGVPVQVSVLGLPAGARPNFIWTASVEGVGLGIGDAACYAYVKAGEKGLAPLTLFDEDPFP